MAGHLRQGGNWGSIPRGLQGGETKLAGFKLLRRGLLLPFDGNRMIRSSTYNCGVYQRQITGLITRVDAGSSPAPATHLFRTEYEKRKDLRSIAELGLAPRLGRGDVGSNPTIPTNYLVIVIKERLVGFS